MPADNWLLNPKSTGLRQSVHNKWSIQLGLLFPLSCFFFDPPVVRCSSTRKASRPCSHSHTTCCSSNTFGKTRTIRSSSVCLSVNGQTVQLIEHNKIQSPIWIMKYINNLRFYESLDNSRVCLARCLQPPVNPLLWTTVTSITPISLVSTMGIKSG